jgi:hypothetical protein
MSIILNTCGFVTVLIEVKLYIIIGDIAQLGERLNGIQEVRGSSPLISTRLKARRRII